MGSRLKLQAELEELLGSANVYFQPPESVRIKYPAIIYHKRNGSLKKADNFPYFFMNSYKVVIIDWDPDKLWIEEMLHKFKYVSVESPYTADNLNHWPFIIHY